MKKLIVIFLLLASTSLYGVDYIGVHRQAEKGNAKFYLFRLNRGSCNSQFFKDANKTELAKKYCVLRYNKSSKKYTKREFFNSFAAANDYFAKIAKADNKNVEKKIKISQGKSFKKQFKKWNEGKTLSAESIEPIEVIR